MRVCSAVAAGPDCKSCQTAVLLLRADCLGLVLWPGAPWRPLTLPGKRLLAAMLRRCGAPCRPPLQGISSSSAKMLDLLREELRAIVLRRAASQQAATQQQQQLQQQLEQQQRPQTVQPVTGVPAARAQPQPPLPQQQVQPVVGVPAVPAAPGHLHQQQQHQAHAQARPPPSSSYEPAPGTVPGIVPGFVAQGVPADEQPAPPQAPQLAMPTPAAVTAAPVPAQPVALGPAAAGGPATLIRANEPPGAVQADALMAQAKRSLSPQPQPDLASAVEQVPPGLQPD